MSPLGQSASSGGFNEDGDNESVGSVTSGHSDHYSDKSDDSDEEDNSR